MNITQNELQYLSNIASSEYGPFNGSQPSTPDEVRECVGFPIWSWCAADEFGQGAGGIASSLVKKGLAGAQRDVDGDTIHLTEAGAQVLITVLRAQRDARRFSDAYPGQTPDIADALEFLHTEGPESAEGTYCNAFLARSAEIEGAA